ncbi:glycosyltransferase [Muricauda sp. SCSIO 64092]|uniref:glycosyltransferase n=1 Tax=Allomuricauda sp. SCSIO 64092 TaxID=2908842 RepID=UPI001FF4EBA2|nr:glycosyltransferase [Muricauda sp. SCSIO 64092]UOY05387.1 glycosyltransferase [Muricauda sp. SCSIO 64092]
MSILVLTLHADPTIQPGAEEGGGTHMYVNEVMNLLIYKQVPALFITRKASFGPALFEYDMVSLSRIKIGPEKQWDKTNLINLEKKINDLIESQITNRSFQPSLIHSIYWYSGRAAMHLSNKLEIPFIHTIISNGLRKRKSGYLVSSQQIEEEKRIFDNASLLISISNEEKNDVVKYYDVDPIKIRVIGRGVDNLFLSELYTENGTLIPRTKPNVK